MNISALILYNEVGTFTYTGTTPTINETFILAGFTGQVSFLNGEEIMVTGVGPTTFTASIVTNTSGNFTGLSAQAISTIGQFVGPNAPDSAPYTGTEWQNVNGILGDTSYASVTTGNSTSASVTNASAEGSAWTNPQDIFSPSAYATIGLTGSETSQTLQLFGFGFSIPTNSTVSGIEITFNAQASAVGNYLSWQLATNGAAIGSAQKVNLSTSLVSFTVGSNQFQWGTALTPSIVNGSPFYLLLNATCTGGTCNFSVNDLVVTIYYTSSSESDALPVEVFNFDVTSTSGVSGLGVTFQAYSTTNTEVILQLLKNGIAVGTAKTQTLTTVPTIYSLGAASDLWGTTWLYSDVNNTKFGVQINTSGSGTTYINDLDTLVYVTPAKVNFNYVKTYEQNDGQITTIALDNSGLIWTENATLTPGTLSLFYSGIVPGSYAKSATADDQEYICFSDLLIGTDRPRVLSPNSQGQLILGPLSMQGPGMYPQIQASLGAGGNSGVLTLTNYSVTTGVITFTFNAVSTAPVIGAIYTISGTGVSTLDGYTFSVLGTPAPTTTQFSALALNATGSGSISGSATPAYQYPISSIKQLPVENTAQPNNTPSGFNGQILLWSAGPGLTTPGSVLTFYYGYVNSPEDKNLINTIATEGVAYVAISNAPMGNGIWAIGPTQHGIGVPPSESGNVPFFTVSYNESGYARYGGPNGNGPNGPGNDAGVWQITLATLTTSTPIPDLSAGDTVTVSGASPSGWNETWTIVAPLTSFVLTINSTQMDAAGNATYGYSIVSGPPGVTSIQTYVPIIAEIVGCTNNAIFNTTGVITTATGSTFIISGFPGSNAISQAPESSAQAETYGTQFAFDPGVNYAGTTPSNYDVVIPGNTTTQPGYIQVVGGNVLQPIGSGTRQAVCFFVTDTGYWSQASPYFQFTTSADANYVSVSNVPLGPSNVVARGIAFTEAGQNGVPGANFYVIENPVTIEGVNGQSSVTYSSTIIQDNTNANGPYKMQFTDAVLLDSTAIDIQGNDLFNLIEIGSPSWCVPYAGRMFYGGMLNKIDNWTTGGGLTFDSYLPNAGGNILPAGWSTALTTGTESTLIPSQVTGLAYFISNTITPGITSVLGMIYQTAYQDNYQVPIINNNTEYSVRATAWCPSGVQVGSLVVDLTTYAKGSGFGAAGYYGQFEVPLSSMSTSQQTFTGTLLTNPFTTGVNEDLVIRVYLANSSNGANVAIDRIEVFPTFQPYITAQVYGSYEDDLEAIDTSGSGGIIDTSIENEQACMGGFVLRDTLYLLKTSSMYSTEDNPNTEPGGWSLREVSNKVGTIGIHSYDSGEEWAVTACRSGIWAFNGGQPEKINLELWNLWECVNWEYGYTIVVRNDITNKRILVAVPMPTGTNPVTGIATATTQWLPYATYDPNPTSPNIILMLNYQGLSNFNELVNSPEMHTTMFGTLAAVDMKRKWSIWQIPTPYMDFITRQNGIDAPLFFCNGIGSSKIYEQLSTQYSDDGQAIYSLYTTYGFVNATKAATLPIFGFHQKRYTVLQVTANGAGTGNIRILPNTINAQYPYTVPGGLPLTTPSYDDYFRPLNVRGNRAFFEISTNEVGSWFNLSKLLLTGRADAWAPINPTGGGNVGISTVQS